MCLRIALAYSSVVASVKDRAHAKDRPALLDVPKTDGSRKDLAEDSAIQAALYKSPRMLGRTLTISRSFFSCNSHVRLGHD